MPRSHVDFLRGFYDSFTVGDYLSSTPGSGRASRSPTRTHMICADQARLPRPAICVTKPSSCTAIASSKSRATHDNRIATILAPIAAAVSRPFMPREPARFSERSENGLATRATGPKTDVTVEDREHLVPEDFSGTLRERTRWFGVPWCSGASGFCAGSSSPDSRLRWCAWLVRNISCLKPAAPASTMPYRHRCWRWSWAILLRSFSNSRRARRRHTSCPPSPPLWRRAAGFSSSGSNYSRRSSSRVRHRLSLVFQRLLLQPPPPPTDHRHRAGTDRRLCCATFDGRRLAGYLELHGNEAVGLRKHRRRPARRHAG